MNRRYYVRNGGASIWAKINRQDHSLIGFVIEMDRNHMVSMPERVADEVMASLAKSNITGFVKEQA